jgi:hypothetical protein
MNDVIALLPTLNKKELEAVIAVASQLLGVNETPAPLAALVYDAISGALNSPMRLPMLPPSLRQRFEKQLPDLTLLFNTDFHGWDDTKNLQIAFLRYMMNLLRDELVRLKLTPTPKLMIDNLPRIGIVFDNAFPNYRTSKLGNLLVMKMHGRVSLRDKTREKVRTNRVS